MGDQFDDASELTEMYLDHALQEQAEAAKDSLEMIEGDFECSECGRELKFLSKARFNAPDILCGECSDFLKKSQKLRKMRDNY